MFCTLVSVSPVLGRYRVNVLIASMEQYPIDFAAWKPLELSSS